MLETATIDVNLRFCTRGCHIRHSLGCSRVPEGGEHLIVHFHVSASAPYPRVQLTPSRQNSAEYNLLRQWQHSN